MPPSPSPRTIGRYQGALLFLASLGAVLLLPLLLALITLVFYVIGLPIRLLTVLFRQTQLRRVLIGGGMAVLASTVTAYMLNRPMAPGRSETLLIRHGMTAQDIAQVLEEQRLIHNALFFTLFTRWIGAERQLRAGEYQLNGDQSTRSILRTLVAGKTILRQVTIPEGLTAREIAGILSREAAIDSAELVKLAYDPGFCRRAGIQAPSLEGYLFPDTYYVPWNTRPRTMIETMLTQFRAVFRDSLVQRTHHLGFTVHQMLTLASIIEREARVDEERPIISGVFHRRLALGRPLEADPTVEYALSTRKRDLLYRDLEVNSPYNTYRYPGLPPGPICNPGRASILAALYPEETPYLYFVAKGDGTHMFTSSKKDHLDAIRQVRASWSNAPPKK